MRLKNLVFITCFLTLSGCEKQPEPFDVSKIDCQKAESVSATADAEHKAKVRPLLIAPGSNPENPDLSQVTIRNGH